MKIGDKVWIEHLIPGHWIECPIVHAFHLMDGGETRTRFHKYAVLDTSPGSSVVNLVVRDANQMRLTKPEPLVK